MLRCARARLSTTPRIMSLLPSATEIVGGLGLEDCLVGVSHECDLAPTAERMRAVLAAGCELVTTSDIDPHTLPQGEIDRRVKAALQSGGDGALYGVDAAAVARAAPTVLLTQTLCGVCAPSTSSVEAVLAAVNVEPVVANLEPTNVDDVAESFRAVAEACGVPERGDALVAAFYAHFDRVRAAAAAASSSRPRVMLLEWLDPPFDGGHWVPEQIEAAGCVPSRNVAGGISVGMSWEDVEDADADVVLIACCGFDLQRNVADALANAPALSKLRAAREGRIFAVDGNRYFVRPSQSLAAGAALVARCAHGPLELDDDDVPEEGVGWSRIDVVAAAVGSGGELPAASGTDAAIAAAGGLSAAGDGGGWAAAHAEAVARGSQTYDDPATGYLVFTSLAHQSRGKCCGSGCRHCSFDHANVRDRARKISRPAWLWPPAEDVSTAAVLFWSGGKDSFLALRKLLADESDPEIVLLTTFDASERRVAHQDVAIQSIVRQAEHLGLPLLGIPLDRVSGEAYVDSIAAGLEAIRRRGVAIKRLCFGDLHLDHIRSWREEALSDLGADLHFPLWHADYGDLAADLRKLGVPCDVSATTVETVSVGARFGEFDTPGLDAFGEQGEFHTLARVWDVPRKAALGVKVMLVVHYTQRLSGFSPRTGAGDSASSVKRTGDAALRASVESSTPAERRPDRRGPRGRGDKRAGVFGPRILSVVYSSVSNHDRRLCIRPVGGPNGCGAGRGKRRCGVGGAGGTCGGGAGRVSAARQMSTVQGARRRRRSKLGIIRAARTSAPCAAQKSSVARSSSFAAITTARRVWMSTADAASLPPAGSIAAAASTQSSNRATTWPGSIWRKRAMRKRGA